VGVSRRSDAGVLFSISGGAAAAGQQNLQIMDLRSSTTSEEATKARAAFTKGEAVVRIGGGSPADFERLVGARIADFHAFSEQNKIPGTGPKKELKLRRPQIATGSPIAAGVRSNATSQSG
jgi:hypothetical protein